jgi:predicted dehydrogenase
MRAAVVGLGIGRHHCEAYAAHSASELVAACDTNQQRLDEFTGRYPDAAGYTDIGQMLERERPDIVSVCTPDWMHADQCELALLAGAHVLVAKPFVTTMDDARRVIATAERAGKHIMVAHERRFHPLFMAMKRLIDQGALGRLFYVQVDSYQHKLRQFTMAPWYADREHVRLAILGTGCHMVDLMRWFGGEVEAAVGFANHLAYPEFPDDDCITAVFRLSSGAIGKVTQTYGSVRGRGGLSEGIVVAHGTEGAIEGEQVYAPKAGLGQNGQWVPLPVEETPAISHQLQVLHFVDCLAKGEPPQPDGREGAHTVAAALAAAQASKEGRLVAPERV